MKQTNKISKVMMVFLCMTALLLFFAACGGSSLVGQWVVVEEGGHPMHADERLEMSFSRNGTGTLTEEWRGEVWVDEFTWSSDNGVLTINYDEWGSDSGPYRINRRRLYLYDDSGQAHTVLERR